MKFGIKSMTLGAVSEADFEKLRQLRRMKALALWLLVAMAIVFAVSFSLQDHYPWFGYVRAAGEGGMVGAIADWFAVTALFRHPLRIPIPHTNLIANKKDDIGEGLGSFIEENFLADDVIHEKLSTISGAKIAGAWLVQKTNAKKLNDVVAQVGLAALTVLNDNDVQELVDALVRKHMIDPEWGPTVGRAAEHVLDDGHHETLIDLAAEQLEQWLVTHPDSFDRIVSSQLPSWMPNFGKRFLDIRAHSEVVKFAHAVRHDPEHPFRKAADEFLFDLVADLQHRPGLIAQVESLKRDVFDSPRIRQLADSTWQAARAALVEMLEDDQSELRTRLTMALQDFGTRLSNDSTLQFKIDVWVMTAVEHLVHTYRHDLAGVVSETVQRWDATEAAEKIELQIGKDLQFIRINGTIVGSLAGLIIYTIASSLQSILA